MATPLSPSSEKSIYFDAPITHFHMSYPSLNNSTTVPAEQPVSVVGEKDLISSDGSFGWLPAVDLPPVTDDTKSSSPKSVSPTSGSTHACSASGPSLFTNADGQKVEGSTFIGGAATTGPNSTAEPDEQLHFRAASADASLTPKQRSKIAKAEAKDGKRLSKVIKEEAKAEKTALNAAIKELTSLQKVQTTAVKNEAKANAARNSVLAEFQKQEAVFLATRTKYEAVQARLHSAEETVETVRNSAKEATERLQEKSQEVDSLRTMYGVDERERAAKLAEIAMAQKAGGSSCVVC